MGLIPDDDFSGDVDDPTRAIALGRGSTVVDGGSQQESR